MEKAWSWKHVWFTGSPREASKAGSYKLRLTHPYQKQCSFHQDLSFLRWKSAHFMSEVMFWKTLQISWCTRGSVGAWELFPHCPSRAPLCKHLWLEQLSSSVLLSGSGHLDACIYICSSSSPSSDWVSWAGWHSGGCVSWCPLVTRFMCVTSLSCQAKMWWRCWDNWHCSICLRCFFFFFVQMGGDRTWKCLLHNCTKQLPLYRARDHVKPLKTGTKTRNSGPKIQMVRELFPFHCWDLTISNTFTEQFSFFC